MCSSRPAKFAAPCAQKKLFYQQDEDASEARDAAPFWCSRTQSAIGPDGKLVGLDECRASRGCCQTT